MVRAKKIATKTKKARFGFILSIFSVLIFFLARIGDGVILIGKGTHFFLKKSFSVIYNDLPLFAKNANRKIKFPHVLRLNNLSTKKLSQFFFERQTQISRSSQQMFHDLHTFFAKLHTLENKIKQLVTRRKTFPEIHLIYVKPKTSRFHLPPLLLGFVLGALVTFFFVFIPFNLYLFIKNLPNPHLLSQRVIPVTTQIFDRNGALLYEIHGDEDRKPIQLAEIPEVVKQATIAIEDKDFYLHPGFSVRAILRAAIATIFSHHVQGGSTLTQQLIKNALLTPEPTLSRKLKEIILAFWAERLYTKDQILEMYLNQVPYGGTAWGIEAGAETYFGKKVTDLNIAEAAYLAGLPAAPTSYSPYGSKPELARVRQKEVLRRMVEDGYISQNQSETAAGKQLDLRPQVTNIEAPHFVMYIRELLSQKYGTRLVDQGGLRITTTLDLSLQKKVQEIVTKQINDLARLRVGNGAALVISPKTGDILAMVGSKDYFSKNQDGNVNVVLSPRQPGSSIKIVNYAAALEKGFTAASIIEDTPVTYGSFGGNYTPVNYDGRFHGLVTLRSALANSYNIPAVKVLNRIGVNTMIEMGRKMGITTWDDPSRFGLSLTLGGGEVTLLNLTQAYAVLANEGQRVDFDPLLKITDYTGHVYYEKGNPRSQSIISPEIAFILSDILADNAARTPAFGPTSSLVVPGKTVSVKTGTTNDKRDNWTLGYTPSVVVGVWVGNNDNSPMDPVLTSGITGAAPIWNEIMQEVLKNKSNETYPIPSNLVKIPCFGKQEYFIKGTQPKNGCGSFPSPKASASP